MKAVLIVLAAVGLPSEISAAMLPGSAGALRGATLTVGRDSQSRFQSLSEALVAARPGETIRVGPGVYEGDVVVDKEITLEGVDNPVVRGGGQGSVITVTADGCRIAGLVIEHSGGDLQREDSAVLLKSNNNHIENNQLRNVLYGIYLFNSRGNIIRGNVINGRPELELGERGAGLHLWNSPNNTIEDNVISETRDGMYIQSSAGNVIRRNRVSKLRYGLHYMFSDENQFEENVFSDNVAGAAIMYSKRIELRRNAFIHNRGFSSFGILFQDCDDCIAQHNFIIDNATGIFMEALRRSRFIGNVIANNDVALKLYGSADANTFSENNFVENLSPLQLVGKATTTRWELEGRGNYWSDYDGYDLDADGVGDVPHKVQNVFEFMEGNYPRLRLFLYSPAAQALAMAEKTFPVVKGSAEVDRAPLVSPNALPRALEPAPRDRPANTALALASLAVFCGAVAVIWSNQRRRGFGRRA
jgi:nitrous oxidase accessory protein